MKNSYVKGFYPVVWVLVACLVVGVIVHQLVGADAEVEPEPFALTDFLSTDRSDSDEMARYQKADPEYQLRFPEDHADHPGFRSEWWYLNGNLRHRDDPSQRFGFQFTVFRQALAPNEIQLRGNGARQNKPRHPGGAQRNPGSRAERPAICLIASCRAWHRPDDRPCSRASRLGIPGCATRPRNDDRKTATFAGGIFIKMRRK